MFTAQELSAFLSLIDFHDDLNEVSEMVEHDVEQLRQKLIETALNFAGMTNMSNLPTIADMMPAGQTIGEVLVNGATNVMDIIGKVASYSASVAPGLTEKLINANPASTIIWLDIDLP